MALGGSIPAAAGPPSHASQPSAERDEFETVWSLVSPIEGWLSEEQGAVLYESAASVPAGCWIVEIGTWHGRSTILLARAKQPTVRLLAIDPFFDRPYGGGEEAFNAFCANVSAAGVDGNLSLFVGTSERGPAVSSFLLDVAGQGESEARVEQPGEIVSDEGADSRARVGLLYVDGAHDRNSVLADIDAWEPFVRIGGLVLFHDAFFRVGVTIALLERHFLNTRFRYLGSVGSLAVFRRERVLGASVSLLSSVQLLGRIGYLGRNMLITPAVRRNWRPLLWLIPPEEACEY